MVKAKFGSLWKKFFPHDGLEVLAGPLAVFAASCAFASVYQSWFGLSIAILFSFLLILLFRTRTSMVMLFSLASAVLLLLLVVFPIIQLYCFLLVLYPILLCFALLVPDPRFTFAAGLLSAISLIRYQGQVDNTELWANVLAVLLNALVYSLLTRMMRKLLKERNEYRQLSMIDSLTGLSSLQQTLIFGQELVVKGIRVRVILIDLDHFKQINDTYGHMIGNKVIVYFASQLSKMMEGINGIVGRLGGDEFVIVMEDSEDNSDVLARIEAHLNHSQYVSSSEQYPIELSFSIGETVSDPGTTSNIEQLMHHADLNMYEYKLSNRLPNKQGKSDHLFDHNPDPIAIFDSEGIMLELNPAAQKAIGYTNEEFKGLPYFKLIVEEDQEAVIEAFNSTITSGSPSHFEMKIISRNGALIPLSVIVIPIRVGYKIAGYYALGKYILESKKVNNEQPHVSTICI